MVLYYFGVEGVDFRKVFEFCISSFFRLLQEIFYLWSELFTWQVVEDTAKFNLHLKVKRGNKEEIFNVEVHKNNEGNYNLNQMNSIEPEFEKK